MTFIKLVLESIVEINSLISSPFLSKSLINKFVESSRFGVLTCKNPPVGPIGPVSDENI